MRFDDMTPRRAPQDGIVPMINIVFLLLVFFLMTATLVPAPEEDVTLAEATGAEADTEPSTLVLRGDGMILYDGMEGEAALARLLSGQPERVYIRADRAAPADRLIAVAKGLTAEGVSDIAIVTVPAP
ncbi:biopolymer transport protein ExbD [Rubricella aquisinus]|uniref:Biopolymer transport protein ExbD n=1 Tax=Rubricella aquisinus TaxID=2028108 RepID=A0A840WML3_9RHOB|nr:biopolymer transporter ExbD [Rubricella aquisinus]MBB5516299.1 biopolymer transport protein ExbD [Rubricella aquisinus]